MQAPLCAVCFEPLPSLARTRLRYRWDDALYDWAVRPNARPRRNDRVRFERPSPTSYQNRREKYPARMHCIGNEATRRTRTITGMSDRHQRTSDRPREKRPAFLPTSLVSCGRWSSWSNFFRQRTKQECACLAAFWSCRQRNSLSKCLRPITLRVTSRACVLFGTRLPRPPVLSCAFRGPRRNAGPTGDSESLTSLELGLAVLLEELAVSPYLACTTPLLRH